MNAEDCQSLVRALSEHRLQRDPLWQQKMQAAIRRGTVVTKAEPQRALVSFEEVRKQAAAEQAREDKRQAQMKRGRRVASRLP